MIARGRGGGWERRGRPRSRVFSPAICARSSRQPLPAPRAQLQGLEQVFLPGRSLGSAALPSQLRGWREAGGAEGGVEGDLTGGEVDPADSNGDTPGEGRPPGPRGIEGDARSARFWNSLGGQRRPLGRRSGFRSRCLRRGGWEVPGAAARSTLPGCHRRAALEVVPGEPPGVRPRRSGLERGWGLRVVRAQPPAGREAAAETPRSCGAPPRPLPSPPLPPPLMAGT